MLQLKVPGLSFNDAVGNSASTFVVIINTGSGSVGHELSSTVAESGVSFNATVSPISMDRASRLEKLHPWLSKSKTHRKAPIPPSSLMNHLSHLSAMKSYISGQKQPTYL